MTGKYKYASPNLPRTRIEKINGKIAIKVIEIPSSELSRGRGGPRCMSMPLVREDL